MNSFENLGLLCALSALAFACSQKPVEREPAYAQDSPAALAPAARTRTAAEQIAQARCEREQACGNVGDNKTFSSEPDCVLRIQSDWKDDLNARQCPGGIDQGQLDECMAQIRAEDCGNPFDTLARITACTKDQICVEEP